MNILLKKKRAQDDLMKRIKLNINFHLPQVVDLLLGQ